MNNKALIIPRIDSLETMTQQEIADNLFNGGAHILINESNWSAEYPTAPVSTAMIAHSGLSLYIMFTARVDEVRAMVTENLGPVADDNCFEFFVKIPGCDRYWNFEFNTLGVANVSSRITRKSPERFTPDKLKQIARYPSTVHPTPAIHGECDLWLIVSIPLSLIGLDNISCPTLLMGNLYSCAAALEHPYYLSWNPIMTDKPDFHRPEYFGYLILE